MLKGEGVILKGGMDIRLGQMADVARLGEEAEVRDPQIPDDTALLGENGPFRLPSVIGMDEEKPKKQHLAREGT